MTQHTRPQRADSCISFVGDFNLRNNRHTPSYHFPMHILPGSKAQKLKSSNGQKLQVWGCLPRLYKVLYDTILAPVTYNTVSIITRISCRSVIVNIYSVQATDRNPINWSYLHDRGRPGPPFLCGLDHLPMSLVICIWITPIIAPKLRRSDERLNPNGDRAITMRVVNCEEGRSRAIGP